MAIYYSADPLLLHRRCNSRDTADNRSSFFSSRADNRYTISTPRPSSHCRLSPASAGEPPPFARDPVRRRPPISAVSEPLTTAADIRRYHQLSCRRALRPTQLHNHLNFSFPLTSRSPPLPFPKCRSTASRTTPAKVCWVARYSSSSFRCTSVHETLPC